MEHAGDPTIGGYARLKGLFRKLQAEAAALGVPTLIFDGGDFTEGSQFNFADKGRHSWVLMNALGYDAVVIGNHDWIVEPADIQKTPPSFPAPTFALLGANFLPSPRLSFIKEHLKPHAVFERGSHRIGVVGLTSPEITYRWLSLGSQIRSHVEVGVQEVASLRRQADYVIALNHLGLKADREAAEHIPGLDLIVGGHSHDLVRPEYVRNLKTGQRVPIVQAWKHGEYVGLLKLDLQPDQAGQKGRIEVRSHEAIPLTDFTATPDAEVADLVRDARLGLEATYGASWLYEKIGESKVPLEKQRSHEATPWSRLVTESFLDSTGADLAIDVPEFNGLAQPAGALNRESLIRLYPRSFDASRPTGWSLWTLEMRGSFLYFFLKSILSRKIHLSVAGITYEASENKDGTLDISRIRLQGQRIHPFRDYVIAVPEGMGAGAVHFSAWLRYTAKNPKDTGVSIWDSIEKRIRKISPITGF